MRKGDDALLISPTPGSAPAHEAEIVLPHMRGACVTVGNVVHTLFRLPPRTPREKTAP